MGSPLALAVAAVALIAATPAAARDYRPGDRIAGPVVQILDADTLRFAIDGGTVDVRLHGLDAPEHNQRCLDAAGRAYACGQAATARLAELIAAVPEPCPSRRMHGLCVRTSRPVVCEVTDLDRRHHRPVARCGTGGTDLAARLVADGWARAYTAKSRDYQVLEAIARGQKRGQWAGSAEDPAEFRRRQANPQRTSITP